MTERELLDELYAAEAAVRSPEHENEMALKAEAMQRAEALADSTYARIRRRDSAIAAWKAHLLDKTGDVNVHEPANFSTEADIFSTVADIRAKLDADLAAQIAALGLKAAVEPDVHEAVAAIADEPPATPDNSGQEEDFAPTEAECAEAIASASFGDMQVMFGGLPSIEDLSNEEQDAVIAVLDDDTPFEGIGGTTGLVIGRPGEVSDAAVAEAQSLDRREAEHTNGATRFNPWA